jgi:hypothetical protein
MTLQRLRLIVMLLVFSGSVLSNRTIAAAQSESATPGHDLPLQYSATAFGQAGSRSTDYQFGILVLNIDKDGKATGTLAPVCKIKFNKNGELEIEHYGQKLGASRM